MVQERAADSERAAENEISRSAATEKKGKKKVSGGDLRRVGAPTKKVNPQNITPAKLTIGAAGSAATGTDGPPRRRVSREDRNSREEKRSRIVRREEEHQQMAEVKEEVVSESEEGQQLAAVEIQKKKKKKATRDMGKEMKQPSGSMDEVWKKKSAMRLESIQKNKASRVVETPETEEVEPEEEAAVGGDVDHVTAGEQEEQQEEEGGNEKEKEAVVAPEEQDVLGTRKFEGIRVLTKPDTTEEKVVARRTRASFKSPLPSRHQSDYCKNHGAINRPIDIDQLSDSEGMASN